MSVSSLWHRILDKFHYRDPLKWAGHVVPQRTDQGVDYWAERGSPIRAMGDAVVTRATLNSGWPGGGCVQYRLTGSGSHKGEEIYVAEFIVPRVREGERVRKGEVIANFTRNWTERVGIETGFIRRGTHEPCSSDTSGVQTEGGRCFARWLHQLGRPTQQDPGRGSTYSPC